MKSEDVLWPELADKTEYPQEKSQALQGCLNTSCHSGWGNQTKATVPRETRPRTQTAEPFTDIPRHCCTVSDTCMLFLRSTGQVIWASSVCNTFRGNVTSEESLLSSSLFFPFKCKWGRMKQSTQWVGKRVFGLQGEH